MLLLPVIAAAAPSGNYKPTPIFDGKTFRGWEGDTNVFRIEKGAIVGGSLKTNLPRNEFLCTTRSYTNFVLRLKFRLIGAGANGGVQIRTKKIPNSNEVSGYQADLGDPNWWGALYDESRRNKVLAPSKITDYSTLLKTNTWNDYEIRCDATRIRLAINGHETVDYTERDPSIEKGGIIGLQIHAGGPSEAWYRDIVIKELP